MTNLDSILKSRDITLSTKVRLVKAMVFLVVMYGCKMKNSASAESLGCLRGVQKADWPLHGVSEPVKCACFCSL